MTCQASIVCHLMCSIMPHIVDITHGEPKFDFASLMDPEFRPVWLLLIFSTDKLKYYIIVNFCAQTLMDAKQGSYGIDVGL